jgi:hypothetical protein
MADELTELLDELDVPEFRRDDLQWLNRNLLINRRGPKASRALEIVKERLKTQNFMRSYGQDHDQN